MAENTVVFLGDVMPSGGHIGASSRLENSGCELLIDSSPVIWAD